MPCVSDEGRDVAKNLAIGSGFTETEWAAVIHEFGIQRVQAEADRGQTNPHHVRTTLATVDGARPASTTSRGALGSVAPADVQAAD